jgi:hypothetical protein
VTLQQKLAEAEAAYHRLQIGKSVREVVDQNGEKIIYTPANRNDLAAYIEQLKGLIATAGGATTARGRAARLWFPG